MNHKAVKVKRCIFSTLINDRTNVSIMNENNKTLLKLNKEESFMRIEIYKDAIVNIA